jgi:HD-like signal output (HDOD) protein
VLATIIKLIETTPPEDQTRVIRQLELELYGADHQHFGSAMCLAWGFPPILASVAAHHHDPMALDPKDQALAIIVCLAEEVVGDCEHGVSNDRGRTEPDPAMLARLGLHEESFESLVESMIEAADDIEAAF